MTAHTMTTTVIVETTQRQHAFDIRRRVFQEEQHVPAEEEFDADDDVATHVLVAVHGVPAGTGRIVFRSGYAKIGRMAVLPEWRRQGVGRALMHALLEIATAQRVRCVVLHAQVQAISFYAALGFRIVGEEFEEAGIPHRRMERVLK
jgi:predicted GNAT family N-acyltransferase